jgi:hypothetical protein
MTWLFGSDWDTLEKLEKTREKTREKLQNKKKRRKMTKKLRKSDFFEKRPDPFSRLFVLYIV